MHAKECMQYGMLISGRTHGNPNPIYIMYLKPNDNY
jgi:hypothetical protein